MGLLVDFLIYAHPEGLSVPVWLGYLAGFTFVLAGLCLLAGAFALVSLQRWLALAIVTSLFVVSFWVALGPGQRQCSVTLPFIQTIVPGTVCRAAFGVGAGLVGLLLVLGLSRFIANRSSA
jgi:hypothetical protein